MYVPEGSVEEHVRRIVANLLRDDTRYDAHHICVMVMKVVPDRKLGSITNRSVAAAAVWNVSRICSLYREDGVPAWMQHDIAKAAGVSGITVRNISKRLREADTDAIL